MKDFWKIISKALEKHAQTPKGPRKFGKAEFNLTRFSFSDFLINFRLSRWHLIDYVVFPAELATC